MPTRVMEDPDFDVEEADEGLLIRFHVVGSKFGAVEVVLPFESVEQLVESLEMAVAFAGADAGDSDG